MWNLSGRDQCYCAFCKSERKLYTKRSVSFVNFFWAAMGSVAIMYSIWGKFDPRVVFIWVLFLAIAETFLQLRWRLTIACRECGFDPVQYLRDPQLAAAKVKAHLERRKEDPVSLFKRPLNLPSMSAQQKVEIEAREKEALSRAQQKNKGKLISRQI